MRMAAIAFSVLLVFSAGNAAAGPINITNIVGDWVAGSVIGGTADVTNSANQGRDIRWPAGAGSQSGLDMTPAADILNAPLAIPFLLGPSTSTSRQAGQSPASAPDPGSTLLLFGIGLAGLRAWRKR